MTTALGQMLRRLGLVFEVLCMLGLLGLSRGTLNFGKGFPIDPSRLLWAGLATGLLLWIAGTIIVFTADRAPNRRRD